MTGKQLLESDLNLYCGSDITITQFMRVNGVWWNKYDPRAKWKLSGPMTFAHKGWDRYLPLLQPATDDHITEIMTSLLTT